MLHPSLHGYLVDQHQRELQHTAEHERLLAEARQSWAGTPAIAERALPSMGRLLIALGLRLCARYPSESQRALLRADSRDVVPSPFGTWPPAMLACVGNATDTFTPTTFAYYGFVTVSPRGIIRAEYATPLTRSITSGRLGSGNRG